MRRHHVRAAGVAVSVALASVWPAARGEGAAGVRVSGPKVVRVAQDVRFSARGLEPRERVTVTLAPTLHRGGTCCGIDVVRDARANSRGVAALRFRWPPYYFNGNRKVRWRHGARADVFVLSRSGRGLRVVRVRRR